MWILSQDSKLVEVLEKLQMICYVRMVFTPNGDIMWNVLLLNSDFCCSILSYMFLVFIVGDAWFTNQWLLFQIGMERYKGEAVQTGTYVYIISGKI